jgi:hypothetical protein
MNFFINKNVKEKFILLPPHEERKNFFQKVKNFINFFPFHHPIGGCRRPLTHKLCTLDILY